MEQDMGQLSVLRNAKCRPSVVIRPEALLDKWRLISRGFPLLVACKDECSHGETAGQLFG